MADGGPAWVQSELPIHDPLEHRVMPQTPQAFFTVNRLASATHADGSEYSRMFQSVHPLREFVDRVTACRGARDTYFSCVATFDQPKRRHVHVAHIMNGLVDLDYYNVPELAGLSPAEAARRYVQHCEDTEKPPPSVILSTGRGLSPKWFWSEPVERAEAGRAIAINRALINHARPFGADPKCSDLTRLGRVLNTVNSKSGRPVEIIYLAGTEAATLTYDFAAFAHAILPPSVDREPEPNTVFPDVAELDREARRYHVPRAFSRLGWHWGVTHDLRHVIRHRYREHGGIAQVGMRDIFGHLIASQMARIFDPSRLYHEIRAVAVELLPADYVARDLPRHSSSLLQHARDGFAYRYRKVRMIELAEITEAEMRDIPLRCLISDAEKARRHAVAERDRRRAAGAIERAAWRAVAAGRAAEALALREIYELSWGDVARRMGLPSADAARKLAGRA